MNNRGAEAENGVPSAAATVKPGVLCAVRACTLLWGCLRPLDLSLVLRGAPDGNLWHAVCGDSPRGGRTAYRTVHKRGLMKEQGRTSFVPLPEGQQRLQRRYEE